MSDLRSLLSAELAPPNMPRFVDTRFNTRYRIPFRFERARGS